jgi:oxygen-independent coproporphyrinogen-3 oxidase
LGFGPSAHSFWENSRWGNVKSLHEYLSKLKNRHFPISFEEELQENQLITEHILLGLRTYRGLSLENFENLFHKKFLNIFHEETQTLIENKLAIVKDGHFRLSEKGMLICDEILSNFTIEN